MPQVEVTFDIDANGILNVSAKDNATGKAHSIVIKASGGLSEEEIQHMINDAATHAEEDKKLHDLIAVRNQADSMIHATEKAMKEAGETVTEEEKNTIETAISELKDVINGEDKALIEQKTQALTEASGKMAERLYAAQAAAQQQTGQQSDTEQTKPEENVVDAEFEEIKEDSKDE